MPRYVWPHALMLYGGLLTEAVRRETPGKAVRLLLEIYGEAAKTLLDPGGLPVALRWMTRPQLGFPRQPFRVWRRSRLERPIQKLVTNPIAIKGTQRVEWGGTSMYEVLVAAAPDAGQTLTVEAVDLQHEVIPGQRIVFNAARAGRFRVPGIAGLRVSGQGTINEVAGVDAVQYANLADWRLIEVVGLPFDTGMIGPPAYHPDPQGLAPGSLSGLKAALVRLEVASILSLAPQPTGVPDIPLPAWPPPQPEPYLKRLFDTGTHAPMRLITECLKRTDDGDPARLQVDYIHQADLPGIRQVDLPGQAPGPEPARAKLPVVPMTLLSASSESFAATALGYGTVDFPPREQQAQPLTHMVAPAPPLTPPGHVDALFDYMVTASFLLPGAKGGKPIGPIELAGLLQARPEPEAPIALVTSTTHANRPPKRDEPATEAVGLTWNVSAHPQGYGVLVSRKPGDSAVLNTRRPAVVGGYEPFIPQRPASANGSPPLDVSSFVDQVSPVPLSGTLTSRYLVAGTDVFGRWSDWRLATHSVAAPPVEKPGVHSARFLPNAASASGRVVPGDLEVVFSWDWSDRSPDRIELTGRFFPSNSTPDAAFTTGLALRATGPVGPALVIRFNSPDAPVVGSGPGATVERWDDPPDPAHPLPPSTTVRKYRAVIHGFSLDFGATSKLAYELYARGAEKVRPGELSDLVGVDGRPLVKVARVDDPLPPSVPNLPVDLRWTALPDAAGRARGVLTWPATPYATGYVVWEATESALRHLLGAAELPTGTSLHDRAASLQALLAGNPDASMHAFSRVNTRVISEPHLELELPASANTLYAYRVSSVSAGNVESARSTSVALFAVPRQNTPGQPKLLLRKAASPATGIDVIAVPGPGPAPVGFRVYRVQSATLLDDVGLMGPPKLLENNPAWHNRDVPSLTAPPVAARAITDPVPESWYPYYYRVVAIGAEDLAQGLVRGESFASGVQSLALPPAALLLQIVGLVKTPLDAVLTFRTNLPVRATPLGPARIDVLHLVPLGGGRTRRDVFLTKAPEQIHEGPPLVPTGSKAVPTPTGALLSVVLPSRPEVVPLPRPPGWPPFPRPPHLPEINRRPPDPHGVAEYTLHLRTADASGVLVVTDPLGRTTEAQF